MGDPHAGDRRAGGHLEAAVSTADPQACLAEPRHGERAAGEGHLSASQEPGGQGGVHLALPPCPECRELHLRLVGA